MAEETNQLLMEVGERVRGLRAKRGMTRKMLASDSGVSERYLAQLEKGRGNISISLLSQVASALAVDLTALLRGSKDLSPEQVLINDLVQTLNAGQQQAALQILYKEFSRDKGRSQRIALMGLRGAGKTSLGRLLAEHIKSPFISLVDEIEHIAGMGISEIFSLSGQAGYRRLEERALTNIIFTNQDCVIETGGSIVAEAKLLNLLLTSCYVVWIKASAEEHMSRVVEQGDLRPMANNEDAMLDLKRILEEREPYYSKAHASLDTSGKTLDRCFNELLTLLPTAAMQETGSA